MIEKKQIEQWKDKYGIVHEISIEDKKCYLRPVDRITLRMVSSTGLDNIDVAEKILANCWLGGDECIKDNDRYFVPVMVIVNELLLVTGAVLKKISNEPEKTPEKTLSTMTGS